MHFSARFKGTNICLNILNSQKNYFLKLKILTEISKDQLFLTILCILLLIKKTLFFFSWFFFKNYIKTTSKYIFVLLN